MAILLLGLMQALQYYWVRVDYQTSINEKGTVSVKEHIMLFWQNSFAEYHVQLQTQHRVFNLFTV